MNIKNQKPTTAKTITMKYSHQVREWDRGMGPCGIAAYNLADGLKRAGYRPVGVYGYYDGMPHFWVEVEENDETFICDPTQISGIHYGGMGEMRKKGYNGEETEMEPVDRFDWADNDAKKAAAHEIESWSDDPTKPEYRLVN